MGNTPQVFDAFRRILKDALSDVFFLRMRVLDTVGLTRFYWILSSNPAILVEISTRITEFEERIQ